MKRTLINAAIILFLDAFLFNQGIFALITLVITLPVILIQALINRKDKPLLKKKLAVFGIYLIMSLSLS